MSGGSKASRDSLQRLPRGPSLCPVLELELGKSKDVRERECACLYSINRLTQVEAVNPRSSARYCPMLRGNTLSPRETRTTEGDIIAGPDSGCRGQADGNREQPPRAAEGGAAHRRRMPSIPRVLYWRRDKSQNRASTADTASQQMTSCTQHIQKIYASTATAPVAKRCSTTQALHDLT